MAIETNIKDKSGSIKEFESLLNEDFKDRKLKEHEIIKATVTEITKNFSLLKGLTIGPGWRKAVKNKVGGIHGCTHLVELLGPIATTAYQTIFSEKAQTLKKYTPPQSKTKMVSEEEQYKPRLLNTCHAFGESSSVVKKRWPNFYKLK